MINFVSNYMSTHYAIRSSLTIKRCPTLALLDAHLRHDPPAAGALRSRLALHSAAASARILRLNADAVALRDLRFAATATAGDPVSAAAKAAATTFAALPDAPAADAELLALWAFDSALALRLRWSRPVPLIATKHLDPGLRTEGGGPRPPPGEPAGVETWRSGGKIAPERQEFCGRAGVANGEAQIA